MRAPGFVDAQAYPIVDRRRPADAASLKHDEIAVGRGLQRAMLVEPRDHVEFVMGDRGTGIERPRLDDQHLVTLLRAIAGRDPAPGARAADAKDRKNLGGGKGVSGRVEPG